MRHDLRLDVRLSSGFLFFVLSYYHAFHDYDSCGFMCESTNAVQSSVVFQE